MKVEILGVKINIDSMREIMSQVESMLAGGQSHYIVTPNPEIILKAKKNSEYKNILNQADISIPDGMGLVILSKRIKQRITGADLMENILRHMYIQKLKAGFIVNKGGLTKSDLLKKQVTKKYPGFKICCYEFEFSNIENAKQITKLNEDQPDAVFIGLGAPMQEYWIQKNVSKLQNIKVFMSVGGGLDYLSGVVKRSPKFLQKIGLEWLYRLFKQPHRIIRIYQAVFVFTFYALKEKIYDKKNDHH